MQTQSSLRLVFAGACLGMLLFGIALITLGSVAIGLREKFSLDAVAAGTLFSILPVGILIGSLLFGPFSDRYGYKAVLILACLLMFSGFQGIAWSSSLTILKMSVFVFGVGGGAVNGATNAVVADISATHKGANLSLLGVFFAVGALGMPSVLGLLEKSLHFSTILSITGFSPLATAALYLFTPFPAPKHSHDLPFRKGAALLGEGVLIAIGFFLFCVSSFEAIINNWTTTYLGERLDIPVNRALFALSLYVGGMAVMRLLLGSALRNLPARAILFVSFCFLLVGCVMLHNTGSYGVALAALVMIGVGLASGFPVMLGFVGNLFAEVSATAFSVVLSIALIGNMLINFLMGIVAANYGVVHLRTVALTLLAVMVVLSFVILKKSKIQHV